VFEMLYSLVASNASLEMLKGRRRMRGPGGTGVLRGQGVVSALVT